MISTPGQKAKSPDILPLLGRGRHRSPRSGACFMELASYLAGEKWSDAPRCTDPSLAALARMVNDATSDRARPGLAPLVPAVVGIRCLPDTFPGDLALLAAAHALPAVAMPHQHALGVGVLRLLDYPAATSQPELRTRALAALSDVPESDRWARRLLQQVGSRRRWRTPAHTMVEVAVQGLGAACAGDVDDRLRSLLTEAIGMAREQADAGMAPPLQVADWREKVRPAL
ncbi:MAG: hypothetical protein ACK5KU_08585 [Beutenbergiaceae bacterium]